MRKPRDFDSELKALADKAKQLKERRVQQLGELVIATGADATDAETLAGALLVIAETSEAQRREAWRKRGTGPSYILIGNRYLYPRQAVSEYLHGLTRERNRSMKAALL